MPTLEHNGATIYYEEFGKGFPILTFAPAGVRSTIAVWSTPMAPINPITEYASSYRVLALDQRNAGGKSRAPITAKDGWHSCSALPVVPPSSPPCSRSSPTWWISG